MSNCTTPYTRFPFLCGNKKAKTVCLGLIVFLERVTGLRDIRCANLNPRNRRLLRRFPKNVPLARFLHGNPPHRFDSLYLVEIKKTKVGFPWLRDLLERVTGIEPASPAWKAGVLPLNYTRKKNGRDDRIRTCDILLPKQARYQTAPRPDATLKHYNKNSDVFFSILLAEYTLLTRAI